MPLPANQTQWPPEDHVYLYQKMNEWAAWYSGEPDRLIDVYASNAGSSLNSSVSGPVPWWRFWSRARALHEGSQRAQLHVPLASDLAAVSGALLFGEAPKIRVREARAEGTTKPTIEEEVGLTEPGSASPPQSPETKTEERLIEIVEGGDMSSRLVEAAESSAAIGGVYIYPVWDKDLKDFPIMAVAQTDNAVPTFRHGFLTAVTFWRALPTIDSEKIIYRHIERHETEGTGETKKAVVLHGLYAGGLTNLGSRVSLTQHPDTADLSPRVDLPFPELDVEYIPNIKPNRLWRSSGHGVADIQGSESLLDALDEIFASWMRDVRLAKARILVPREYLRMDADGKQGFDFDQEVYVPMEMEPGLSQDARAMLAHQFQIRYLEHRETATSFIDRIVSNAGYVPQTLGEGSSLRGGDTGTALRVAEHKTLLTLRKKSGWWRTAISNVLYHMLIIDNEVFGQKNVVDRPTVQLSDSIIDNPLELAQTALAMKTAESASVETRVRLLHPDWSSGEVKAEVEKIEGSLEAAKVTTQDRGTFGDDNQDPASTENTPVTAPPSGPVPTNAPPPQVPSAK